MPLSHINSRLTGAPTGRRLVLVHGVGSHLQSWDGVIAQFDSLAFRRTGRLPSPLVGEGQGGGDRRTAGVGLPPTPNPSPPGGGELWSVSTPVGGAPRCAIRCLAYDLRGHGASARVPGPYTIDDFVGDLAALTRHLGWDRFDIAGFSLGGIIAQAFAIAHPEAVRTLTIISSIAGRTEEERTRVLKRAETLAKAGAGAHLTDAVERWFTDDFRRRHPEVVAARQALSRSNDPACYAAAYRVLAETDLANRLTEIRCPTLVMTGEEDQGSTPRMARLMAERIAGAECHILPKLRHSVLLEAPDQVAAPMAAFLDRTASLA